MNNIKRVVVMFRKSSTRKLKDNKKHYILNTICIFTSYSDIYHNISPFTT